MKTSGKRYNVRFLIGLSAALVVTLCGGIMWMVNSHNVETLGVNKAKSLADQVVTLREFYTQQVVSRAKESGMRIDHDWAVTPNTLPLPATFTNELGTHIKRKTPVRPFASIVNTRSPIEKGPKPMTNLKWMHSGS